jgi:hypothetical protein
VSERDLILPLLIIRVLAFNVKLMKELNKSAYSNFPVYSSRTAGLCLQQVNQAVDPEILTGI